MSRMFRNFFKVSLVVSCFLFSDRLEAQSGCGGRADAVDFVYNSGTWHDWASGADYWIDPMGWCQVDSWTGGWGYTDEWNWLYFADQFDEHTPTGYDLAYIPPSPIQCPAGKRPAMWVRSDGWIANAWCEEVPQPPHTLAPYEIADWYSIAGMFFDFAVGIGPDTAIYRAGTIQVYDMQQAPGLQGAIDYWYNINSSQIAYGDCQNLQPVRQNSRFGLRGYLDSGGNATRQFVGSYQVDILPHPDGSATIKIYNVTSMTSLLLDIGPSWSRSTFPPGGNEAQIYTWEQQMCGPAR